MEIPHGVVAVVVGLQMLTVECLLSRTHFHDAFAYTFVTSNANPSSTQSPPTHLSILDVRKIP